MDVGGESALDTLLVPASHQEDSVLSSSQVKLIRWLAFWLAAGMFQDTLVRVRACHEVTDKKRSPSTVALALLVWGSTEERTPAMSSSSGSSSKISKRFKLR